MRKWINKRLGRADPDTPKSRESSQTPKSNKDSNKEGKILSDKKRTKQQEKFSQQNQQAYLEYMKFKDPKSKGRQDVPGSPTQKHGRKVSRDQAISPRQGRTKQHLQILVRHYSNVQSQKLNLSNFI